MAHATEDVTAGPDLRYSDAIAAARTMIALEGNAAALQRRLPSGWELAPTPAMTYAAPHCEAPTC